MIHQYSRAERLLTRPFKIGRQNPAPQPNGTASTVIPTLQQAPGALLRLPMGPGEIVTSNSEQRTGGVSTLVELSVACRYLAAQCMVSAMVYLACCFITTSRSAKVTGVEPQTFLGKTTRFAIQVGGYDTCSCMQ